MKKSFTISPQLNKRLISTLMSSKNNSSDDHSFSLKATSEFASRSKDVFGELQVLEERHETWVSENKIVENNEEPSILNTQDDSEAFKKPLSVCQWKKKRAECQESDKSEQVPNFKKPFPVKQKYCEPQFKLQPDKWKKYSLKNIPLSSDATNTAAAMQFIEKIRQQKKQLHSDLPESSDKIVFNKPLRKKLKTAPDSSSNSSHINSYECDVSSNQEDSISSDCKKRNLNVTLAHLEEEDSCE